MQGEDQERFEDYLELERYIEELQAGHVAHPPTNLTPAQVRIYQMAALFRSLSPDAIGPSPEFAAQLKEQLLAADAAEHDLSDEPTALMQAVHKPVVEPTAAPLPEQPPTHFTPVQRPQQPQQPAASKRKKLSFFTRRSLLAGGAVAAASLTVGAVAEHLATQTATPTPIVSTGHPTSSSYTQVDIAPDIATTWLPVIALQQLGTSAVRFATDSVVGYVIRVAADVDETAKEGTVIALSAACTHMGCIVKWQDSDHLFHCPCHNGLFDAAGTFINIKYGYNLAPLPRLNTKIENNMVYVEVPAR
jgi:Rieske Fe-S protein